MVNKTSLHHHPSAREEPPELVPCPLRGCPPRLVAKLGSDSGVRLMVPRALGGPGGAIGSPALLAARIRPHAHSTYLLTYLTYLTYLAYLTHLTHLTQLNST